MQLRPRAVRAVSLTSSGLFWHRPSVGRMRSRAPRQLLQREAQLPPRMGDQRAYLKYRGSPVAPGREPRVTGPTPWDGWTHCHRLVVDTGQRPHGGAPCRSPALPPRQGLDLSSGSREFAPKVQVSECLEDRLQKPLYRGERESLQPY